MRSSFWQGWTYKTSLVPQVYFNDFKIFFFYNHTSQQYVLCTNQNMFIVNYLLNIFRQRIDGGSRGRDLLLCRAVFFFV